MNHLYTFAIQLIDRYNGLEWRPAFWGLGWRCCQWWSLDYNTDRTPSHADILRQWLLIQIAVIPMQHAAFWFNQLKWLFFHNSDKITYNRFRIQTSFHWLGSMKGYSCRHVLGFFYEWGDNVIKSDFDQSPARRTCLVFLLLCKRKVSCTWSTRRFIFQRYNVPKKIFVCRTPGHTRIHYHQQNNSVIMWTHFPLITPDKIIYHRLVGSGLFVYTKLSNRRSQEFNILEFWMPTVLVTEVIIGIRSSTVYM